MANLHNTNNSSPQEPDEISLFLQQIILRSSNVRRHSLAEEGGQEPPGLAGPGPLFEPGIPSGLDPANASSSSGGKLDNSEENEYADYESEEIVEAIVEGTVPKPTPSRSSSKRSRAAEVHNLSEKRRRSRINEKMKALQNLIPNSNKTDKASMLDEAIEYLKQLQLQVQMLTMRNGLSLYPVCLPGMLQPNQMPQSAYEMDKLSNANITKLVSIDQNISPNELLCVQDKRVKQPANDFSSVIGSKASFEVESSMQGHFGIYNCSRSSKLERVLPRQPINDDRPQTSSTGAKKATSSIPRDTNESISKEDTFEGACLAGDHLLHNLISDPIFSSQFEYLTSSK